MRKTQFALILYTKSHFGAIFGPTCMYTMLRNFGTVPPAVTNLVSKCAGNSKENCHKVSRRELCALPSNRAICRGGAIMVLPPPPSLIRVKVYPGRLCNEDEAPSNLLSAKGWDRVNGVR